MSSFLQISGFRSSFPDCHCLLSIVQVLLLLKAHIPALAIPMEFPSGREIFHFFFLITMDNRMKRKCFSHHTFHTLSAQHCFHAQISKLFVILHNIHTQSSSAPALKRALPMNEPPLHGYPSDSEG